MLISYCREIKTFYCTLLSALLIKLTPIKNWKKYTIYWLQNFLTVKNLVQLSDRPTMYEVSKNNVFVLPVNPIRSRELNLSLAVMPQSKTDLLSKQSNELKLVIIYKRAQEQRVLMH